MHARSNLWLLSFNNPEYSLLQACFNVETPLSLNPPPPSGPSATAATREEKSQQPTSQVAVLPLGLQNANTRWYNSSFTEEPDTYSKENEGAGMVMDDAEIVESVP